MAHEQKNPSYQQTVENTFTEHQTSENGLSEEEARKRLLTYGPNTLTQKRKTNPIKIFLSQFTNPLVILLVAAGLVSFFLSEFLDAGFIAIIVIINAVVGFIQEYKAENTIRALKKLLSPKSIVLREGVQKEIDSVRIVPGDIVLLTAGNAVPCDMRLFQVENLRVDESTLTGESVPVSKDAHVIHDSAQVADQHNLVFMGTTVVAGKALAVAVATGNTTFLGSIAEKANKAETEESPLVKKFSAFARTIGIIVVASTVVISLMQLYLGEDLRIIFKTAVGIAVAAIPEGLPIIATIALSLAVQKMGRKKAVIRQLPAAETLGSTTVICTDKTGTLTMNQMEVVKLYDGAAEYQPGHIYNRKSDSKLTNLIKCGYICTEAPELHRKSKDDVHIDPTEQAIVRSSLKTGVKKEDLEELEYLDLIPFQNEKRYMATLVRHNAVKKLYVKGSPEKILAMSGLDHDARILEVIEKYATQGLRLVACAEKKVEESIVKISDSHMSKGFVFLGMFALIDPPRDDVKNAIAVCKKAGVKVVMITGDHPSTARAIAIDLGIADNEGRVVTGQEMLSMSDQTLKNNASSVSVFARVTPDQKLRIVEALKEAGEIVAVTGDGVNDAPALRSAHIGVAMGGKGTDVAKEASHMVILDDNFSTIVKAIREARVLFENIRKATFFLVPSGFSVILTIIVAILMGYAIPFTAIQLLWVNLVTNGLQDISLAFEPEEKGALERPPRSPKEGIMSPTLYRRALLVAITITVGVVIMYSGAIRAGMSEEQARTVALSTMIIFQFFQLFNARSETLSVFRMNPFSNKLLLFAMGIASIAFILSFVFEPLKWVLETTHLPPGILLQSTLMAFSVIVVVEIDKAITKRANVFRVNNKSLQAE